jgi:predicted protein tyrosine phosphatase
MKCLDITKARWFKKSLKKHNPECIISIGSPGTKPPRAFTKSNLPKLRLEFLDVEDDREGSPVKEDIKALIDFGYKHLYKTFVIHCRAGISRSSACAIILEALDGEDLKWVYPKLYSKFKRIRPNEKVLRLGGLLRTKGQQEIYAYWKKLFNERFKWWFHYF